MMVDIGKINFYVAFRSNLFIVPLILVIYLYMIFDEVGVLVLAAVGVIFLSIFGQSFVNKFFRRANLQRMGISDKRVKKINEIIQGIKIIKFNAWESIFQKSVVDMRRGETELIWKTMTLYNIAHSISTLIPTVLGLVVFTLYEIQNGRQLEISRVYKLVTLFNSLLIPLRFYIMAMTALIDSKARSEERRVGKEC